MYFFCGGMTSPCTNQMHRNQDTYATIRLYDTNKTEIALILVSDGVSMGYEGKYASYNTAHVLLEWANEYFEAHAFEIGAVAQEIQNLMQDCNSALNRFSEQSGSAEDTCATLCGMITDGKEALFFNAGDSRLYEINANHKAAFRYTNDDVAEDGHSIAMHIGGKNDGEVVVSFSRADFKTDSVYIVCTDGMYRELNFEKWHDRFFEINTQEDWQKLYEEMLRDVRALGEDDDVTATLLFGR